MPPPNSKYNSDVLVPKVQTTLASWFNMPQKQRNECDRRHETSSQDCPTSQWHSLRKRYLQLLRKIFFNSCIEFVSRFFWDLLAWRNVFIAKRKDANRWVHKITLENGKGKTIASFRNFCRQEGEKQNTLQRSCSMKMVQVLWVGFARIWPP